MCFVCLSRMDVSQSIAPLSRDRKMRGLVQGAIFGTTNLLLYATYGTFYRQVLIRNGFQSTTCSSRFFQRFKSPTFSFLPMFHAPPTSSSTPLTVRDGFRDNSFLFSCLPMFHSSPTSFFSTPLTVRFIHKWDVDSFLKRYNICFVHRFMIARI